MRIKQTIKFRLATTVLILLVLLFISGWVLRIYLSSDYFSRKIETIAKASGGVELALEHAIKVESLFPALHVYIPTAKVKLLNSENRMHFRIREAYATLPFSEIIHFDTGHFSINIDHVTMIASKVENPVPIEKEQDNTREAGEYLGLAKRLQGISGKININKIQAIYRPTRALSHHVKLSNFQLSAGNTKAVITATYLYSPRRQQPIVLTLDNKSTETDLATLFSLEAKTGIDRYSSPVSASGKIILNNDGVNVEQVKFDYARNSIRANAQYQFAGQRLNGDINLRRLELSELLQQTTPPGRHKMKKLFTRQRLLANGFLPDEIDVDIDFGAIRYHNRPLISGKMVFTKKDNNLDLYASNLRLLGAPARLQLMGTNLGSLPVFDFAANIDNLKLRRFHFSQDKGGEPIFTEGQSQLEVKLSFAGNSTQALAQSISGHIKYAASEAELSIQAVKFIDKSLLSYAKTGFSHTENKVIEDGAEEIEREKGLPVSCINAFIAFDNGYGAADRTMIMETRDNILSSTGYLDLHREAIGFTFASESRRFIDWSPISLVKYLEIKGPLAEPDFTLNKTEVTKKGILTAASLVFGPIPGLAFSAIEMSRQYAKGQPQCEPYVP